MPKVHLLEDELINKIAAGEVVDRPASVVKELVENAIDAGASLVEVELIDGGRQLILVRDNGCGMSREDAALSVKRHCTSKIRSIDDLFQIGSMGFRGEALAAISAVSEFTLQTKQENGEGTQVKVTDGSDMQATAWNGPTGTTIAVKNLFGTIPARKAFLKTAAAEYAVCHEYINALALSKAGVAIRLRHNEKIQLDLDAQNYEESALWTEQIMKNRFEGVFGKLDSSLLYLKKEDKFGSVEAIVSPPGLEKSSGKQILTFVNKRWVKDKTLRYAILRGYHSHLLKGKFPICFLNLEVDPGLIDVNVHPAKAEIRFQYARETQNLIATAIKERLREGDWAHERAGASCFQSYQPIANEADQANSLRSSIDNKPNTNYDLGSYQAPSVEDDLQMLSSTVSTSNKRSPKTSYYSSAENKSRILSFDAGSVVPRRESRVVDERMSQAKGSSPASSFEFDFQASESEASGVTASSRELTEEAARPQESGYLPWHEMTFLGAFHKCYLLFSWQEQLVALDQHAFHERILYERFAKDSSLLKQSQRMLVPEVLDCSATELASILENQAALEEIGFEISSVSSTEVELRRVPTILKDAAFDQLVPTLAKQLDQDEMSSHLSHNVLSTLACHSAVRAGEELPELELKQLLAEAHTVDFYHNCPHGRRVVKFFSRRDVEKWFDR